MLFRSDGEDENQHRAEGEGWKREAEETDKAKGVVLPAGTADGGHDSGGDGEDQAQQQGGDRQFDGVGVACGDEVQDCVIEPDGPAQVAVEDVAPVVQILDVERQVKPVLVAQGGEVACGCAFAEHLLDWVAGDEMDEQEDERDDYPDYGEGQGYAGEDRLHGLLQR